MKIYIIGPCSTGKSTLSEKLSRELNIKQISLDDFYIDFNSITVTHRSVFSRKKIDEKIDQMMKQNDWIVEGPYFEKRIIDEADLIVYSRRNLWLALLWQWKRFFTDPVQIKKWGVVNNLLLSWLIINQYWQNGEKFEFQEVEYPTVRFLDEILKNKKLVKKVQMLNHKNPEPVIK